MDYNELLSKAKNDLAELIKKEAVLNETIKTKAAELGLSVDDKLTENLKSMQSQLNADIKTNEAEIEKLTQELSQISLSIDE